MIRASKDGESLPSLCKPYSFFIMSKTLAVKFPRIMAGFYYVTLEGEVVGYVSKKVDGKEVSWQIYQTTETDLSQENLAPSSMVDETELFREAKDFAKNFFLTATSEMTEEQPNEVQDEVETPTLELQEPEWNETEEVAIEEDFFDDVNMSEEMEEELALV